MQSNKATSVPAVLILTRDEAIGALGDALWTAGVDCARAGSWNDARQILGRQRIYMVVVDGDLPSDELEAIAAGLPDVDVQAVLWLVSSDAARSEHLRLPQTSVRWERVSKPLWPEELLFRAKAVLGRA